MHRVSWPSSGRVQVCRLDHCVHFGAGLAHGDVQYLGSTLAMSGNQCQRPWHCMARGLTYEVRRILANPWLVRSTDLRVLHLTGENVHCEINWTKGWAEDSFSASRC